MEVWRECGLLYVKDIIVLRLFRGFPSFASFQLLLFKSSTQFKMLNLGQILASKCGGEIF
jgi:hypothetical protein